MVLPTDLFPSGVLHLILFDARLHPVSERLVFINSQDQAKTTYSANRENYARRSLVKNSVTITGSYGQPLVGNFSVSVTSDREVTQDSTSTILTQLLLASDLRGHIENPAYYFQNTPQSIYALDLLMCTQGWRRYHVAEWAQGRFSWPAFPIETETHISGTVKNLVWGRPVEDVEVTVLTLLFTNGYFNSGYTDKEGRFTLPIGEFPDSTRFSVSVDPKKGMTNMDLTIDRENFPNRTLTVVPPMEVDRNRFAQYAYKAEQQYVSEGGVRVTELSAAIVTAERIVRPPIKSQYYIDPSNSLTEEQLEKLNVPKNDIVALLQQFPGVYIQRMSQDGGRMQWQLGEFDISIQGSRYPPLLLVDDIPTEIKYLDHMSVADIAQIDILKDAGNTSVYGVRAFGGVISIYTKRGDNTSQASTPSDHIKFVAPLGYQLPVEFYAPQYETEAQRNALRPDLRTTIHWQPAVQTDSRGVATFEFYTADEPTSYTVVIEGLGADGQIIRKETKLWGK
jgi:TonB-dependent SusC/RagA subfamily outer membrane receptor